MPLEIKSVSVSSQEDLQETVKKNFVAEFIQR